jgi:hypothetical protein
LILLDNEPISVPKLISAQKLLKDKFILEFSNNDKNKTNKIKKIRIELNLGDIACFVKPCADFVCDTHFAKANVSHLKKYILVNCWHVNEH